MLTAVKLGDNVDDLFRVGSLTLAGRALLAPMAGCTDPVMRRIAERCGASATVAEMVTPEGLARGDRETALRLAAAGGGPRVIQIAARDPASIAAAARGAEHAGAELIDINMGCPCKRVTGGLAGAALMRDLDQAAALVAAAVRAVSAPVSVKMRLGWDESSRNAPELARRVEAEGAVMVTVHGRTRAQLYTGQSDWAAIGAVKQAVSIPVVANGDCGGAEDACEMLRLSGADAVMVGRAAVGRPWLVGDIAHFLAAGRRRAEPSMDARAQIALEHLQGLIEAMGDGPGLRHARKHLAAYAGAAGCGATAEEASLRRLLVTTNDPFEARGIIERLFAVQAKKEAA